MQKATQAKQQGILSLPPEFRKDVLSFSRSLGEFKPGALGGLSGNEFADSLLQGAASSLGMPQKKTTAKVWTMSSGVTHMWMRFAVD